MSAPDETAISNREPLTPQPAWAGVKAQQSPNADPTPLAHEALLALARLIGRQAAIETMNSNSATSKTLQPRSTS